ncbi:MAG: hypothetical protein ACOX60_06145 [Massiliimalia sp.]
MKRITAMLLAALLMVSMTACGGNDKQTSGAENSSQVSGSSQTSDGGTLEAEKNLLDVEVTLPASLIGDSETSLTEEAKAAGITDITKNEDGSITLKMTKQAHKDLLNSMKASIDESIAEILADKESCPSFEAITYNDDVSEFTVTVDPATFGDIQALYSIALLTIGNMYGAVNAVPAEELNTVVNFVDKSTGEVIDSRSFNDMKAWAEGLTGSAE